MKYKYFDPPPSERIYIPTVAEAEESVAPRLAHERERRLHLALLRIGGHLTYSYRGGSVKVIVEMIPEAFSAIEDDVREILKERGWGVTGVESEQGNTQVTVAPL